MRVMGIDPGINGAIAFLDTRQEQAEVFDMPTFEVSKVGAKNRRRRLDYNNALQLFRKAQMFAFDLIIIENVHAVQGDGAVGSFTFGEIKGALLGMAYMTGCPIETPQPASWKRDMKLTKDKDLSIQLADRSLPAFRHLWRGPAGGYKHDRAEAVLLALWGARQLAPYREL